MEPLTALGIASNIAQFVDFTWKLITETRAIRRSATGFSGEVLLLDTILADVERLNEQFNQGSQQDGDLLKLTSECKKIASELRTAIETLKVQGTHSTWSSFRVAFKQVSSRSKLESITTRLGKIQAQIAQHVLLELRNDVSNLAHTLAKIVTNNEHYQLQAEANLATLREEVLGVLGRFDAGNGQTRMQKYARIKHPNRHLEREDESLEAQVSIDTELLHNTLSSLETAIRRNDLQLSFLQAIYFREIPLRCQAISDVHRSTCNWIFEKIPISGDGGIPTHEHVNFVDWLRSHNSTFWITGKPGSGKSTLLRFIAFHEKVEQHLKVWAGDSPVLIARFFFWNAGAMREKSREGLLRAIIFGLLRQSQHLLQATMSQTNTWALDYFQQCTDLEYLYKMYDFIAEQARPAKICLFIDGLDEFQEPNQPLDQLLVCIRKLRAHPNVKMCVSSKPWPEFEDEFGHHASLKVEDLTREDIRKYVLDKFNDHPQFLKLAQMDPSYSDFIDTIVYHAQWVFLWVFLVVREMLQGLTFNDSLATLHSRLQTFPPDLNNFFQHILGMIPKAYQKQTARYFKIALESQRRLPLLLYSFLDDIENDHSYALNLEFTNREVKSREARMPLARRRLDGRSRGLLECQLDDQDGNETMVVDFLHRTVRDFLVESAETQTALWEPISSTNDTGLLVCHAILAYAKTAEFPFLRVRESYRIGIGRLHLFEVLFGLGSTYSGGDPVRQQTLYSVLAVVEKSVLKTGGLKIISWGQSAPDYSATCLALFLGMAARFGMSWYISSRLSEIGSPSVQRKLLREKTSISPLDPPFMRGGCIPQHRRRSIECISLLLEAGADPNAKNTAYTGSVWSTFLVMHLISPESEERDFLIAIIRIFLAYGAQITRKAAVPRISATHESHPSQLWKSQRPTSAWDENKRSGRIVGSRLGESNDSIGIVTAQTILEVYCGAEETKRLIREARFRKPVVGPIESLKMALKTLLK